MLRTAGLTKRYPSGEQALAGVDLDIPAGATVAVIGPSGAGKSTLLRCINRLVEPTFGKVWLGDVELTRLAARELRTARRRIGMIFQEFALVERLTVMENVLSGALGRTGFWPSVRRRFPQAALDAAFELLDQVGLTDLENKRVDALSGGQRQRVGVARALMQQPSLLLVDEPTASLDPRTARQILRLIVDQCRARQVTALINIHDVPLAQQFVDHVLGLAAGKIVFDGAPAALTPPVLTSIYGAEDWTGGEREPA